MVPEFLSPPPLSPSLPLSPPLSCTHCHIFNHVPNLPCINTFRDVLQYLDDLKSGRISPPTPSSLQTTAGQTTPGRPEATVKSTPVPVVKFDSRSQLPSVGDKKMSYQDVPLDEVQRSRAEQMVQSKMTTPHIYATASCNVQRLVELSNALGESNG